MKSPNSTRVSTIRTTDSVFCGQAFSLSALITMLKNWEVKLSDFYDRTGEEAMNDITRREVMISRVPPKI